MRPELSNPLPEASIDMSTLFIIFIIFQALVIGYFIGFLSGKYKERIAWNGLIDRGILPAPKSKTKLDFSKSRIIDLT